MMPCNRQMLKEWYSSPMDCSIRSWSPVQQTRHPINDMIGRWARLVTTTLALSVFHLTTAFPSSIADLRHSNTAKPPYAFSCIISTGTGNLLQTELIDRVVVRAFDRDFDGQRDLETYTEVIGGPNTERPFPYLYLLDDDGDEKPDRKFIDLQGNGRCEDIREIPLTQHPS